VTIKSFITKREESNGALQNIRCDVGRRRNGERLRRGFKVAEKNPTVINDHDKNTGTSKMGGGITPFWEKREQVAGRKGPYKNWRLAQE